MRFRIGSSPIVELTAKTAQPGGRRGVLLSEAFAIFLRRLVIHQCSQDIHQPNNQKDAHNSNQKHPSPSHAVIHPIHVISPGKSTQF
jgi:hypothetical protein